MILISLEVKDPSPEYLRRSDVEEFEGKVYTVYTMYRDMRDFEVSEKEDYYLLLQEEQGIELHVLEGVQDGLAIKIRSAIRYSQMLSMRYFEWLSYPWGAGK